MTRYQAYFIGFDGQFLHYRAFACDRDEHAVEWAKQLMDRWPVELWSGARLVKRLSPLTTFGVRTALTPAA
jgi:hypothetical protein